MPVFVAWGLEARKASVVFDKLIEIEEYVLGRVAMGRSNNQLRRSAKARGKPFIPKQVKSKARNQHRKLKIMAIKKDPKLFKKLSYDKVKGKNGKVQKRKFRAGGYNHSGKFGKAFGVKATAKKAEGK